MDCKFRNKSATNHPVTSTMDEQQFIQQLAAHQHILHKICRLYRDSREDREDLFQEMVFQLWRSAPSFQGRSKFTSWMYQVALHTALAGFRKKQPRIVYPEALPEQAVPETDEAASEQLMAALKKLNDADKALITLYLEELSYQEIAEITGISENYVGVKLNRIKQKLQKWIK